MEAQAVTDKHKQRAEEIVKKHEDYKRDRANPNWCPETGRHRACGELFTCSPCMAEDIARTLSEAVAEERERCAKVADSGFDCTCAAKIREKK